MMLNYRLLAALLLVLAPCAFADGITASSLTGHWQLNSSQSTGDHETRSLEITQTGDQVAVVRTYRSDRGRDAAEVYKCSVGVNKCQLVDADGRKAGVSFWFNGPELVMLKTGGDKRDSTVEWHFQTKDGTTLQVSREVIEPRDMKENLVFNRVEAVAEK